MEKAINVFLPPKCISCNKIGKSICYACLMSCDTHQQSICVVCQKPSIKGKTHKLCENKYLPQQFCSIFLYKDVVRKCIRNAKYSSKAFYPLKKLTDEALRIFSQRGYTLNNYVVVPVPLNKKREKSRGFNQAEIISKNISSKLKLPLETKVLKRKKATESQYLMSKAGRKENMKNAFLAKNCVNKKILLVDDICTTGSTLINCSKALLKSGAEQVFCFTLAIKLLDENTCT